MLTIPPAVHAQSTQPASQPTPTTEGEDGSKLPVSLDRIREGVQREPKLKIDFLDPSIPLFRVHVQENAIKLEDYWKIGPDTAVSRDVRPAHASMWHHEFLSMTTPKQHIAASPFGIFGNPVYPVGPPVLAVSKALKQLLTNVERGRIRRQIQEELKQIEANKSQQTQQEPQQTPAQQTPTGTNGSKPPSEPAAKQPAPRNPNDPR